MTKTVYKVDLDLSTTKLEEIYPGRAYVRHGGRKERIIHHKDGTISTASSIIWTEEEVTQVWMECVENSDEAEVRKAFLLHLSMAGGVLNINLTAKQYNRLSETKYTKPAADLLVRILKKDGQGLLIRKLAAEERFSFRAHRKVAKLIHENSKKCGLSEGEYIEKCCADITPRLAFDEEEKNLLREFMKGRQDCQFMWNMLTVWKKGKTRQQLEDAVIMGEYFIPLRKHMATLMQEWDKTIGKLLNRQIQAKE